MNEGKIFEQQFKASIPKDVFYFRIKDSPPDFNNDNPNIRYTPKNDYDAIVYKEPIMMPLELKSTSGTSFSFTGKTPMIKEHQIKALTQAAEYSGVVPGFIFNMRKYPNTYFLHINDFNRFLNETNKKSINKQDIIDYGAVEIIGVIKKVKYKYDVGEFIEKMKSDKEGI